MNGKEICILGTHIKLILLYCCISWKAKEPKKKTEEKERPLVPTTMHRHFSLKSDPPWVIVLPSVCLDVKEEEVLVLILVESMFVVGQWFAGSAVSFGKANAGATQSLEASFTSR